jgi:cysteine synthase
MTQPFDEPEYHVDRTVTVRNEDAVATVEEIAITEGIVVDMLSGAVINAATQISQYEENFGKTILVVLSGITERHVSTTLL